MGEDRRPLQSPKSQMADDQPMMMDAPVDRGPEVVASSLAPQLGSDAKHLGKGESDMRKLSIISEKDIPNLIYASVRSKKTKVWGEIRDEFLNLQVSVGGRGRRDIIRMEGVSKGGLPELPPENEKPGWFSRNFVDRSWKKRSKEDAM